MMAVMMRPARLRLPMAPLQLCSWVAPLAALVLGSSSCSPAVPRLDPRQPASPGTSSRRLSDCVNTLRGSDSTRDFSYGNTFPAVALPFGFNFWTAITEGNSDRWLYNYRTPTIKGFAVSHEPSPWIGDHGSIQVMPMSGELRLSPDDRASAFSHTSEIARAHYYRVILDKYGVDVEFTPTDHASVFKFTFSKSGQAHILFDSVDAAPGALSIDASSRTVQGHVDHNGPRLYFFASVDKEVNSSGVQPSSKATGWLQFEVTAGETVTMTMGTSFLSLAQARSNLDQEVGTKSFDQVRELAAAAWDKVLGKIEIEGATDEQRVTFYSNMYRLFLFPNSMWERVGEDYKYFSPYTLREAAGRIYVNGGFWDTYRAVWPLFSLLVPSQTADMLQGFVTSYKDGGWVPRWSGPGYVDCMVGSHSDIVFADAYLRGVTGFDIKAAYESMLKNALVYSSDGARGRKGNDRSIFSGYLACDLFDESAAWTMEDAINDFGIAQVARSLGDKTYDAYFSNRALRYANLFSTSVGFFRGRKSDGNWRTSDAAFFANEWGYEFTEGAPWHYSAAATSDPQGMANLYGGRTPFSTKLDSVFAAERDYRTGSFGEVIHEMREAFETNLGQYAHSNEPIHSLIYMYDYAGTPSKAQRRVRQVLDRLYDSGFSTGRGYLGDEDNGQMSAWYIFSALGFYPASPGHPEYAMGSPLFNKATIHLENGKQFVVSAPANSSNNVYIQSAKLNGKVYSKNYLRHTDVMAGGLLELTMGPSETAWGTDEADLPSSMTPTAGGGIPAMRFDRAIGGRVSASSENVTANQGKELAFDDDSLTQWQALEGNPSIQYTFADNSRCSISLYTLTSGADAPESDPQDWLLQGANNCGTDNPIWVTVDQRSDEVFVWRRNTRAFSVNDHTPYGCFRLLVLKNHGGARTQLAELELIGDAPIGPAQ